jgi:ABC-2 type transport system ATP-binding protein
MIEVADIRKSFNGNRALDGFSLRVAQGELVGLVGPNGAGKTTLIKILATLLAPSNGIARIAGMDVRHSRNSVKKLVGYLPDQPGLYQEMRVREFLQFFADAFHVRKENQPAVIENALARANLSDRSASFVEELSFGLKQRLVLAKTLLHSPQVLLLDEPATGLDPIARLELRHQLRQLNAEGITILISSHILSDLEDICTRVALISGGKNAVDTDGNQVIQLVRPSTEVRFYEIELLGSASDAAQLVALVPGVKVVGAEGGLLTLELAGGTTEAAALLRRLITSGSDVVRFNPRSFTLEERYQQAFRRKQP